jgi:RNA polymerase sigma-70 factor (ECF subfamily)
LWLDLLLLYPEAEEVMRHKNDGHQRNPRHLLPRSRGYLCFVARLYLDPRLAPKMDASDVVQQTLLEAVARQEQFCGTTEAEFMGWLRQSLRHNLADALRTFQQARRDLLRERPLEEAVQNSSRRLEHCLADDEPGVPEQAEQRERAFLLAEALEQLPRRQREALVCQHWHGWTLARIGEHLDCSPEAVAGLLKRGLQKMRELLQDWE